MEKRGLVVAGLADVGIHVLERSVQLVDAVTQGLEVDLADRHLTGPQLAFALAAP